MFYYDHDNSVPSTYDAILITKMETDFVLIQFNFFELLVDFLTHFKWNSFAFSMFFFVMTPQNPIWEQARGQNGKN